MDIQLSDEVGGDVHVRTFNTPVHGGGIELENRVGQKDQYVSICKRDIPVLIIFLQSALKELESGNNNS